MPSPYERALDLDGLDPHLRRYFGEIPAGSVGVGRGVFDVVGTPKVWLWPMLWLLGRQGVVFAAWARDVPFTVVNRPDGGALHGTRIFHFAGRDRSMIDIISASPGLVDELGTRRRYRATLRGEVVDAGLRLSSTSLSYGRIPLRGTVEVVERWLDGMQHVEVVISAPIIGRVYEYSGYFTYEITEDHVLTP